MTIANAGTLIENRNADDVRRRLSMPWIFGSELSSAVR